MRGFTSETRVTMPRTVTSFPMASAFTSRITRGLALEGALKYSSLRDQAQHQGVAVAGAGQKDPPARPPFCRSAPSNLPHPSPPGEAAATHNRRNSSEGKRFCGSRACPGSSRARPSISSRCSR